jgi:hypothetical protein
MLCVTAPYLRQNQNLILSILELGHIHITVHQARNLAPHRSMCVAPLPCEFEACRALILLTMGEAPWRKRSLKS